MVSTPCQLQIWILHRVCNSGYRLATGASEYRMLQTTCRTQICGLQGALSIRACSATSEMAVAVGLCISVTLCCLTCLLCMSRQLMWLAIVAYHREEEQVAVQGSVQHVPTLKCAQVLCTDQFQHKVHQSPPLHHLPSLP